MSDIINWMVGCGSNVLGGDGCACLVKAETSNLIALAIGIGLIIYGVKHKEKVKKTLGSIVKCFKK